MGLTLGKRIVANRKRLGMTQDQLADKLGVTAQAVSKWENDLSCPDISMLPQLAEIFGITTDELLGREPEQKIYTGQIVEDQEPMGSGEEQECDGIHFQKGSWDFHWDNGRKGALSFSVLVLAIGVLYLLSHFCQWNVNFWNIAWPTALVVFGLFGLFPRFSFFSLGCALFGGYFLLSNLNILHLNLGGEVVWAVILILFGVSLLVDTLKKPKKPRFQIHFDGKKKNSTAVHTENIQEDAFRCDASFCEQSYDIELPRLSSGSASISFGEMTIDLSGVEEVAEGCAIDADCSFAQMTLLVPKHYQAAVTRNASFGDVAVHGRPDAAVCGTIAINASASFGQIDIRYI